MTLKATRIYPKDLSVQLDGLSEPEKQQLKSLDSNNNGIIDIQEAIDFVRQYPSDQKVIPLLLKHSASLVWQARHDFKTDAIISSSDPLRDSNHDGRVDAAQTTQFLTKSRSPQVKDFILAFEGYLHHLAYLATQTPINFSSAKIEKGQVLALASQLPENAKAFVSPLISAIELSYRDTSNQSYARNVENIASNLTQTLAPYGYYVAVEIRGENVASVGWLLEKGVLTTWQEYSTYQWDSRQSKLSPHQQSMDCYLVKEVSAGMASSHKRGQNIALTNPINQNDPFSMVNLDRIVETFKNVKLVKSDSWILREWRERTQHWLAEDKQRLYINAATHHELKHHADYLNHFFSNLRPGPGLARQQTEVETSAMFAMVAYSEHPILDIYFLLISNSNIENDVSYLGTQPGEFHRMPHSIAVLNFLIALAREYDLSVPKNQTVFSTDWVKDLISKIESATPSPEANRAILRTKVAIVHQKFYNRPLAALQSTLPEQTISFTGDESISSPEISLEKAKKQRTKIELKKRLKALAKEYQETAQGRRHNITSRLVILNRVTLQSGPFNKEEIEALGGYEASQWAHQQVIQVLNEHNFNAQELVVLAKRNKEAYLLLSRVIKKIADQL